MEERNLFKRCQHGEDMTETASFEELRAKWLELIKLTKIADAGTLYWEKLFPLIENNFLGKNKVVDEYDWLVLPCGLETSYYLLLIKALQPKKVYFIGTEEFRDHFLDSIVNKVGLKASQYIIDTVHYDELDIAEVYEKIRAQLDNFLGKKVIMDLTRGKRIMSVGAGIVGAFFGFDLVYIDEEWVDEIKRGLPGTEKLVMVRNPFEVFGDLELKEARDFLNQHNYSAALALYKRIKQKIVDPRMIEIEELLSETYLHWNSFNFKAARSKLQLVLNKVQQYNFKQLQGILDNIIALQVLTEGENNSSVKSAEFNLHVIVDLYANALRKAEVGVFEDSISRLYRVLELISQYRLQNYRIDTLNPKIKQYEQAYRTATKELYGFEKELPLEIGLKDGYLLLFILQDYLLEGYSLQDLKRLFGVVRARDMSIIAHGLQLAGEKVFVNMNQLAKTFIQHLCAHEGRDFSSLLKQHTFVKL